MSPSKAAKPPSPMPTGCSPTAAAATAACRRSGSTRSSSSWRSASTASWRRLALRQELAALAIVQARGDLIEAIFLVRAYRTTLPRFGYTRRSTRRDAGRAPRLGDLQGPARRPGARPDLRLHAPPARSGACRRRATSPNRSSARRRREPMPRVSDILAGEGLIEPDGELPQDHVTGDITREPLEFPMARDIRLQALARGDEGFLLALGYSTQRGYARNHPFVGEIRIGEVEVELDVPELPFAVPLGRIRVTECQMVNQFKGSAKAPPQFTRGYGLVFGQSERKAMAMSLCDRALRAARIRRGCRRRRAGRGVRHLAFRQCPGDRLRRAPEAAALCRLPGRARPGAPHARRARGPRKRRQDGRQAGGRGMNGLPITVIVAICSASTAIPWSRYAHAPSQDDRLRPVALL